MQRPAWLKKSPLATDHIYLYFSSTIILNWIFSTYLNMNIHFKLSQKWIKGSFFVHSQTFHNREPGLNVDNTVNQLRPAWTHCLRIWTCLHSPLRFHSGFMCYKLSLDCGNVVTVMEFIMFHVSWKWRLFCRPPVPSGVIQKQTSKRDTTVTFKELISLRNYITWRTRLSINSF